MTQPSPKAHLARLAALLIAALVLFIIAKQVITPSSWNFKDWYRGEALTLNASYEIVYGGNDSCKECHADVNEEVGQFRHQQLSCESCHGALADHAKAGEKIGDAIVDDESTWQCLNCHDARISKPQNFPQFDRKKIEEHRDMEDDMLCIACHEAHDPTP